MASSLMKRYHYIVKATVKGSRFQIVLTLGLGSRKALGVHVISQRFSGICVSLVPRRLPPFERTSGVLSEICRHRLNVKTRMSLVTAYTVYFKFTF